MLALLVALRLFFLEGDALRTEPADDDRPRPVGSLVKPFVAKAWARSHPGAHPPVSVCEARSGCWRVSGHGRSGLPRAVAISCNAYFRALAAEVPRAILEATLGEEGFVVSRPLSAETAIGLPGEGALLVRPSSLLRAYRRLTREPWPVGEAVRGEVLAGLRDGALRGTASGIGRRGYWAKTGTIPALDGRALATSGWVVAIDDAGRAVLGLLEDGTGRQAAGALAGPLDRLGRGTGAGASSRALVRVGLFGVLRSQALTARNVGPTPSPSSRGFLGPGGRVSLRAGDRLGDGLWELSPEDRGFVRRIRGSITCVSGPSGTLRVQAEVSPQEYVAGVLRAELACGNQDRRVGLGAAVLRFLAAGARHATEDVCDSTHCAWFLGRGPRLLWPSPTRPVVEAGDGPTLDSGTWDRILSAAREEGPPFWTTHCGGRALSPHFLWGGGDRRLWTCPRHRPSGESAWTRRLGAAQLAKAFGAPVRALSLSEDGGVWGLRVETTEGIRSLAYDEAHRILGWDALPSPADRLSVVPGGFEASGVGRGHRVGLCLAD